MTDADIMITTLTNFGKFFIVRVFVSCLTIISSTSA